MSAVIHEVYAARAECVPCHWKGPYRATRYDAEPDRVQHDSKHHREE